MTTVTNMTTEWVKVYPCKCVHHFVQDSSKTSLDFNDKHLCEIKKVLCKQHRPKPRSVLSYTVDEVFDMLPQSSASLRMKRMNELIENNKVDRGTTEHANWSEIARLKYEVAKQGGNVEDIKRAKRYMWIWNAIDQGLYTRVKTHVDIYEQQFTQYMGKIFGEGTYQLQHSGVTYSHSDTILLLWKLHHVEKEYFIQCCEYMYYY